MTGRRPARRVPWRDAVASAAFPSELRVVRGTLLCLTALMTPDGILDKERVSLADAAGVPARTLDRHVSRAVAAGWLDHVTAGGNGRNGVYLASIPTDELCATYGAQPVELCAIHSCATPQSCAPPSGALIKRESERSEHVACNSNREPRDDHDGGREPQTDRTCEQTPPALASVRPSVPTPRVTGGTSRKPDGGRVLDATQEGPGQGKRAVDIGTSPLAGLLDKLMAMTA